MHTALEEAKEEVWRRWHVPDLRNKVATFLGGNVPEVFQGEPRAVIFRQLASPNFEFYHFADLTCDACVKPVCLEYAEDKFCARNPDKVLLGKMVFHRGTGRNGGIKTSRRRVIDFADSSMKCFSGCSTVWSESFISFHHRLIPTEMSVVQLHDFSAWFIKMGPTPLVYYERFLAMFICHGILFENFLLEGDEGRFCREVVLPALARLKDRFGVRPLICRLRPEESEADPFWCWYPGHIEKEVARSMSPGTLGAGAAMVQEDQDRRGRRR